MNCSHDTNSERHHAAPVGCGMMLLGYCCASLAAALMLFVVGGSSSRSHGLRSDAVAVFAFSLIIMFLALLPAGFAITYAASRRIRSLRYYVLAGMGAALFASFISGFIFLPGGLYAVTILLFGGMVAGLVFWGVAGRNV
jgi:hypothetical protein